MNTRLYWKIRKRILTFVFRIKSLWFRTGDSLESWNEYRSFKMIIFKNIFQGIVKTLLIIAICHLIDNFIDWGLIAANISKVLPIDSNIFVDVIIGGIGVAGVILGLYCANVSSIYSASYINAPSKIALAFQYDRLTKKCISTIITYIIFGVSVILKVLMFKSIGWGTAITSILWLIYVVISYSIAGNRTYQLSDVYRVADDSYRLLNRIINKALIKERFAYDVNFQNHFLRVAEKQLGLRETIQEYGDKVSIGDSTSKIEFLGANLALLSDYWKVKSTIDKESLWFRAEAKYQKWHLTGDTETSIAIRTGTSLRAKEERNYWWFEDEIISITKSCLVNMFERHEYEFLYNYMLLWEKVCCVAIDNMAVEFYLRHTNWLRAQLERCKASENADNTTRKFYASMVEILTVLYLDIILEGSKHYQHYCLDATVNKVTVAIDSGRDVAKSAALRGRDKTTVYKKIITEVTTTGKRITPDWLIRQYVAHDEYTYLNSLIDNARDGIANIFEFGKNLLASKMNLEACIVLTRWYEYESKLDQFVETARSVEEYLRGFQLDTEIKWGGFRLEKLKEDITKWRSEIPALLLKSTSEFAICNWENRDEYPDFLGDYYNHICEDAVEAIAQNNLAQFSIDFENLSKLMLLYQEYIRSDFVKKRDLYRVEYAYYMFTSPIVEWAQIGGLAILWGEFLACDNWKNKVSAIACSVLTKNGENTSDLAEKLIEYIQHRDRFMIGIGHRDILETGWNQIVERAIRKHDKFEIEYVLYGKSIKTNSSLLKAFCGDSFEDLGFTSDPSEVFWTCCVNSLVPKEKRFKTKYSWEEKMND